MHELGRLELIKWKVKQAKREYEALIKEKLDSESAMWALRDLWQKWFGEEDADNSTM